MATNGSYRFKLGAFECVVLRDGARSTTLQQSFPGVPEDELIEVAKALGYSNEVTSGYNCLYVATPEHRILVDTGGGSGELLDNLKTIGVTPDSVDTVILTHGDGDHIGGVASFPKSCFVMSEQAFELWSHPDKRKGMVEEFIKLFRGNVSDDELEARAERRDAFGAQTLPALGDRLSPVPAGSEVLPGIRLIAAPGHRSDHTALELHSEGETLLHVADAFRHPIQLMHPEWTSFIDSDPEGTAATARILLHKAADEKALVFATHLPFPALGRVKRTDSGLRWEIVTDGELV